MAKAPGTRPGRRASIRSNDYLDVEAKLPRLMRLAFDAYCARVSALKCENTKEFVAGQAACRAALAHFMLLVRLSDRLSQRNEAAEDRQDDIDNIILEARVALEKEESV